MLTQIPPIDTLHPSDELGMPNKSWRVRFPNGGESIAASYLSPNESLIYPVKFLALLLERRSPLADVNHFNQIERSDALLNVDAARTPTVTQIAAIRRFEIRAKHEGISGLGKIIFDLGGRPGFALPGISRIPAYRSIIDETCMRRTGFIRKRTLFTLVAREHVF